jgi:hypothetical protein
MADRVLLTLDMTPEERQQIEELAHQRGYPSPREYLLALVTSDASKLDAETDLSDDDEDAMILAGLRTSWHAAMTGDIRPIEELWAVLDEDDE